MSFVWHACHMHRARPNEGPPEPHGVLSSNYCCGLTDCLPPGIAPPPYDMGFWNSRILSGRKRRVYIETLSRTTAVHKAAGGMLGGGGSCAPSAQQCKDMDDPRVDWRCWYGTDALFSY